MKNRRNIIEQKYPPENPNDLWMKDDILYKSTHEGWTPLTAGNGLSTNGVISTTWQKLKDKRDAGKLIPGVLYRITDYQCTTTQENTQSAGHQFDIVLLALNENKLAEEGWAMMHDNIYDVTFSDGVTKKCWLYNYTLDYYTIVDIETNLGLTNLTVGRGDIIVNNATKTATTPAPSNAMTNPNLPYNYFQNSNLSAWKVWYCLDNNKSRFAWADDSVDEGSPAIINGTFVRDSTKDMGGKYAWWYAGSDPLITDNPIFTDNDIPEIGDSTYIYGKNFATYGIVESFTPAQEGTNLPNGRGVIYRLIDEWNNDVAYDFKNIQFIRPMTNGEYDPDGEDTWCYTYTWYNPDNTTIEDCSISEGVKGTVIDFYNELYNNVVLNPEGTCFKFLDGTYGCTIIASSSITMLSCDSLVISNENFSIYINNKKVLTES